MSAILTIFAFIFGLSIGVILLDHINKLVEEKATIFENFGKKAN